MSRIMVSCLFAGALLVSACNQQPEAKAPGGAEIGEKAGSQSIAEALPADGSFMQLAKAAGLEKTLAGPDPYTVLVPSDAAFAKLPEGKVDSLRKPEQRAELTRTLTYHILPGVVLSEDIGKTIDNSKGKAVLATIGGETLTVTREDGKLVFTDAAGGKATVTKADQTRSNGVVHEVDSVLSPAKPG